MGTWKEQLSEFVVTPALKLHANIAIGMSKTVCVSICIMETVGYYLKRSSRVAV